MKHRGWTGVALFVGLATLFGAIRVAAQEWPQWRGPNRDGATLSFRAPSAWPETLSSHWKVEIGEGYATPLLVGERLYVFSRLGEEEVMTALNAVSGEVVWRTRYAAPFEMNSATRRHGPGPKSTPTFADGRLYSFGMSSIVTAFDADTGEQIWQRPATEAQPRFHTAMSPIVEGNRVIIHTGGPGDTALLSLDAVTGDVQWQWDGDSPAYGSPIITDIAGVRQVVTFTRQHLVGLSVETGELLWSRPFETPSDTTAQTPIIFGDTVIQAGRENGITAFRVFQRGGDWVTEDVWHTDEVSLHLTNGVVVNGIMYGLSHLNAGQYFGLDLTDGTVLWTSPPRQAENAAMVSAGDAVFSLENDAELVVLEASREGFNPIRRYTVADSETWTQPVIAGSSVYVKDVTHLTQWTFD